VAEQPSLSFAGLLRQLRAEAKLTQEELAEAASLSPRSVSDLERGINRTARKDTALLLAGALGLTGPSGELFVAAARGRAPAAEALAAARGGRSQREGAASPYRGLSVFEEQDAPFFFGREAATAQVLDRMARLLAGAGLLVVSGVSGAGKSSLLRAGVLPQVRAAGLAGAPGAATWPCLVFTPTRAPLDELALQVAVPARANAAAVRRELEAHPEGFALTARQVAMARAPGPAQVPGAAHDQWQRRLLLVVDQFEELFTQCAEEAQRRAFITALHAAGATAHGPGQAPGALVVMGVRADFEARCADYPQLAGPVQDRYLVTAMTERQLRMAITEPAKKAGSSVGDDLVEVLLAEVSAGHPGATGAGALPLLSHALDQAWRSRTGPEVSLADYERVGGIEGAVAGSAQRAYDRLTPAQQAAARQVFTRLAVISGEGVDAADRVTRAELTEGRNAAEAQDVAAVLEAFAAERLLTLAPSTVELSHEVLLTAWPLLRDTWLADTQADRIVRTRLHTTAGEWARHERDPSYLYSGSLLQAAADTAARIAADPARHPPLNQIERDFLHASDHAHRRTARRRQAVIAGLLALTLIAVTTAGIAVHNAANATRQHALALSRQLAAESLSINPANPVTARRLAVAAWRVFPTGQAGSVMTTLLAEQQQNGILPADESAVWAVAFSPNGKLLATAGLDGTVRLWDPLTGQAVGVPLRAPGARGAVFTVAFSPSGRLLATAGADGRVRLWNPATGRSVGRPIHATTASGGVYGVAFSPDGKLLASADGYSEMVRLWNPATGRPVGAPLQTGGQGGVFEVTFSPDGKLLASAGGDGKVHVWDSATGQPVSAPAQNGVSGVGFSRNGKLLVSVGADGRVRLWDSATGHSLGAPLQTASHNGVSGVSFSRNGKLLATGNDNGTIRVRDLVTGRPVGAPLQIGSFETGQYGVAFSPNGRLLASADSNGTVRLWNPATGQAAGPPLPAPGAPNDVFWVAFSRNGKVLASAYGAYASMRLWNLATAQPIGPPHQTSFPTGVNGVAFSPNGKLLVSVGADGTIRLWNPATTRPIGPPHQTGIPNGVNAVAFSPNSKLLATAGADGRVRLWDPVTGRPVSAPLHADAGADAMVNGVAFSPDGKLLASADGHGTVRLWDPVTGRPVGAPLHADTGPGGSVNAVAFSPNGKLLASADGDGTVRLWDPVTGQPISAPLPTGTPGVVGLAFSPDGRLLATAGSDDTVQLWNVSLFTHPYAALCTDVGPPTVQDWAKYAPGEPQPKICA
jgi:WD40 repeat protein/transcriptional regulator with XRE-family HTH domain